MRVEKIDEVGANRPQCVHTIQIDADLKTNAARYSASERRRKGLPIDQCGQRASFIVDDRALCRPHAGQVALDHMLAASSRPSVLDLPACPFCGKTREAFSARSTCGHGGCPWGGDF
jgi:hypothetical protein